MTTMLSPGWKAAADGLLVTAFALAASMVVFGAFVAADGVDPFALYGLMIKGSFGSWFSLQNSLQRASPLLLTALCTALPAQLGMVVIGGEGALVLGGLAAVAAGVPLAATGLPAWAVQLAMGLAGMAAGGAVIGGVGALKQWRGVNETIASLLVSYIAIAVFNQLVEGPLRDPASLNKPSTAALPDAVMLPEIPGTSVHVGLLAGVVFCVAAYVLLTHTTFGFAAWIAGGNVRAARMAGLPVGRLVLTVTFLGGAAAGLAGMIEIAAVQGRANAALAAGYGYSGILVAFLARQNPLAVIPVSLLLGGIAASGGLVQRRLGLPDATVLVLQGILFVTLLASESLAGRLRWPSLPISRRHRPPAVRAVADNKEVLR